MIIGLFVFSIVSWVLILNTLPNQLSRISAFNVFFVFFLMFDFVGFTYLSYNDFQVTTYGNLLNHRSYFQQLFLINMLVMWSIVILYTVLMKLVPSKDLNILGSKIPYFLQKKTFRNNILLMALCLSILFVYFSKVGFSNLSVIKLITGASVEEVLIARNDSGNLVDNYHWYKLFFRDVLFIVLSVFYILKNRCESKFAHLLWYLTFILIFFTSIMTGEKSLLIDLFLLVFCSIQLIQNNGFIKVKSILIFFFLSIGGISLTYSLFMPAETSRLLLIGIWERLSIGQLIPGIYYLRIFPDVHNFLLGTSFPNPMGIFGYDPVELTVLVMNFSGYNAVGDKLGIIGTMPFLFWGEMYANFGYFGIFVAIVFVSILFFAVDKLLYVKVRRNIWFGALYLYLIVHLKDLAVTGLFGFIFDLNLFVIILFIYIFRINYKAKSMS
jgi:hypothetical protein